MNIVMSIIPVIAVIFGVAGCANEQSDAAPNSRSPGMRMSIVTQVGEYTSVFPAVLKLMASNDAAIAELGLSASMNGKLWGLFGVIDANELESAKNNLSIIEGPITVGKASIQLSTTQSLNEPKRGSAGRVSLGLAPGRITGTAVVTPDELAGSIEGDLIVECWVPQSAQKNASGNGVIDDNGVESLVEDVDLKSDLCAPLRKWRE